MAKTKKDNGFTISDAAAGKRLATILPSLDKLVTQQELEGAESSLGTIRLGMKLKKLKPVGEDGMAIAITVKQLDAHLKALDLKLRPDAGERALHRLYIGAMVAACGAMCLGGASMLFVYGACGLLAVATAAVYGAYKRSAFDAQGQPKPPKPPTVKRESKSALATMKGCAAAFNQKAKQAKASAKGIAAKFAPKLKK